MLHEHGCELAGELNGAPRFIRLERLPATVAVDLELEADRRGRYVVQFEVGPDEAETLAQARPGDGGKGEQGVPRLGRSGERLLELLARVDTPLRRC